jgi:hypothetical protein
MPLVALGKVARELSPNEVDPASGVGATGPSDEAS